MTQPKDLHVLARRNRCQLTRHRDMFFFLEGLVCWAHSTNLFGVVMRTSSYDDDLFNQFAFAGMRQTNPPTIQYKHSKLIDGAPA